MEPMITTERFRQRLYEAAAIDHTTLRRWLTDTGIGVGVAQTILPKDMNGRDSIPSAEKLVAIAAATGRSVDWFLGLDEESMGQLHALRANAGAQADEFAYIPRRDGPKTSLSLALGLPRDWIEERLRANPRDMTAVTVRDAAMAPTLLEGDIVLVDGGFRSVSDGLYVIDVRGGVTVRRLQHVGDKVHLLCDDVRYPPLIAAMDPVLHSLREPGTANEIGYVVGRVVGAISVIR